jgi:lysophospholipase L1-like esterase
VRQLGLVVWSLLLLLGRSAALAQSPQSPLVVWCFGDSITEIYAPVLAALKPEWNVRNLGIAGETSDVGLARLRALLDPNELDPNSNPHPDIVVVFEGTNDVNHKLFGDPNFSYGAVGAASNVRAMVASVRAAGAIPITGLPVGTIKPTVFPIELRSHVVDFRRELRTLGSLLRRQSPKVHFKLRYIDEFTPGSFFVHESYLGALVMSRRVVVVVNRLLSQGIISTSTTIPTSTSTTTSTETPTTTTTSCISDGNPCAVDGDCCAGSCQVGVCGTTSTTTSTLP